MSLKTVENQALHLFYATSSSKSQGIERQSLYFKCEFEVEGECEVEDEDEVEVGV